MSPKGESHASNNLALSGNHIGRGVYLPKNLGKNGKPKNRGTGGKFTFVKGAFPTKKADAIGATQLRLRSSKGSIKDAKVEKGDKNLIQKKKKSPRKKEKKRGDGDKKRWNPERRLAVS